MSEKRSSLVATIRADDDRHCGIYIKVVAKANGFNDVRIEWEHNDEQGETYYFLATDGALEMAKALIEAVLRGQETILS